MYGSNIVSVSMNENDLKDGDLMLETDVVAVFNAIYDSTNKPVLAFITARCGNTSDIGDIFQDTYMELYRILDRRGAEYVTNGKALVFKIAKRKLARNYSALKRLQIFISMTAKDDDNGEIDFSGEDINLYLTDNTEDYVVNQILLDDSRRFIQQKPADIKKIFYLFYDLGLSIPEIAKELSMTESNVKNKFYRTVKEIQNLLLKEGK